MEPLYRLVYSGERVPGRHIDDIVQRFSKRFQVRQETARDLILDGARHVLKSDLDLERAERYRSSLERTGLLVHLERQELPDQRPGSPAGQVSAPDPAARVAPAIEVPQGEGGGPGTGGDGGGATPCPKCGAIAVSPVTGICDACGVVAERYLARRLAEPREGAASGNPDARPEAAPIFATTDQADGSLRDPIGVPASRGWGWIGDAWALFLDNHWSWLGAILLYLIILLALGFLPFFGQILSTVLGPLFTAGLMIGAHTQVNGGRFQVSHLFAGFSHNPGRLFLLTLVYLGAGLVVLAVIGTGFALLFLGAGGDFSSFPTDGGEFDPEALGQMGPLLALPVLLALLIAVPVTMLFVFAPALVALHDVPVLRALRLSFLGCWRNLLPLLIFGLGGLALLLVGSIPLGLGLLVVFPLLIIGLYVAYRDIFLA